MSHTALSDMPSPQCPLRRSTTLAIHRHTDAALSPVDRSAFPQSQPLSPAYIYPANPLSFPSAGPKLHLPSTKDQPTIAQVAFSLQASNANTGGNARADRRRSSSNSPADIGMTVGSPKSGKVVDVVGSFTNPSIVYAPVRKDSKIGGAEKGKATMQHSHGIGGSFGKDWMADRPSGIGASVAHDAHPKSGISKALKALGVKKSK
ncbi:hypothetical protein GGI22_006236 [Coemansia erecta]|nr:hypothetical protein GGI22_006236 [Coemansia erecta]